MYPFIDYGDDGGDGSDGGDPYTPQRSPLFRAKTNPFDNLFQPNQSPNNNGMDNVSTDSMGGGQSQSSSIDPLGFQSAYLDLARRRNGPAMQAYSKYLAQGYPDEKNYQPGKLTKLAAVLSGIATSMKGDPENSYRVMDQIMGDPYKKAISKYQSEGERLRQGAALEETRNKDSMAGLKDVYDANLKRADLERKNKLADAQIATNAARAKTAGQIVKQDENTGHILVFYNDGTKDDLGKLSETADEKSLRKVSEAVGEEVGKSPIIQNREINVAGAKSGMDLNREKTMNDIQFGQKNEFEKTRQVNRLDLAKNREDAIANRVASNTRPTSESQREKKAKQIVQSIVDDDPGRYNQYWDGASLSAPPTNPVKHADWKKLYDALYGGLDSSSSSTTKGKVTAGGNSIERQK